MTTLNRRTLVQGALAATGALAGPPLLEWASAWAQAAPWKSEKGAQLALLRVGQGVRRQQLVPLQRLRPRPGHR